MTVADERAGRIIRDRRRIVNTLRMVYPGWMPGEELFLILLDGNPEYDRRCLVKDATYLNEKGYLMFRGSAGIEARVVSVRNCEFRLTAAGTDVADRLVKDPTLEL
jgi:hypothetical protein